MNKFIKYSILLSLCFIGCESIETGCIYPNACNYNPEAEEDDGNCEYESCIGCLDVTACNYNPDTIIEDNTTCIYSDPWLDCQGQNILNKYIGEWTFNRVSGYSNPYESGENQTTFTGFINLGNEINTILITTNYYSSGEYYFEEFSVSETGDEIEDINNIYYYNFNGYFTGDSLVYITGANGSPFQQSSFTIYGQKIK